VGRDITVGNQESRIRRGTRSRSGLLMVIRDQSNGKMQDRVKMLAY
jgi:hypothetical protein